MFEVSSLTYSTDESYNLWLCLIRYEPVFLLEWCDYQRHMIVLYSSNIHVYRLSNMFLFICFIKYFYEYLFDRIHFCIIVCYKKKDYMFIIMNINILQICPVLFTFIWLSTFVFCRLCVIFPSFQVSKNVLILWTNKHFIHVGPIRDRSFFFF